MRFFDFPPEIRNLIYMYLQPTGKTIKPIFTIDSRHNGKSVASFTFPAKVFNVSRAFDKEAATVFFSQNIFSFNSPYSCFDFMERIGNFKSASLQFIEMERFIHGSQSAQSLAQKCPQLKRIEFGDVEPTGSNGEWAMNTLECIQALALALPHLGQISYVKVAGRLDRKSVV